ncbi:MAG: NifU family protein [Candidatus Jacksonbacteria bacterium]|nr:NifU family protein [Candidatus Jacksonbacteria bacterium]
MQEQNLKDKIEDFFSESIKPQIQLDGGDIHLLGIEPLEKGGYAVKVELDGACVGCSLSSITLYMGVEARLRQMFPEVKKVEVV